MYILNVRWALFCALFKKSKESPYYFVQPSQIPEWNLDTLWKYAKELFDGPLKDSTIRDLVSADMMPVSLYMRSLGVWDAYTFHGNSTDEWESSLRQLEEHLNTEPKVYRPLEFESMEDLFQRHSLRPAQYVIVDGTPYWASEGQTRGTVLRELVVIGEKEVWIHCDSWKNAEKKFFDLFTVRVLEDGTVQFTGSFSPFMLDLVAKVSRRAVTAILASCRILGESTPPNIPMEISKWTIAEKLSGQDHTTWMSLD